jgi:hypothetical protein
MRETPSTQRYYVPGLLMQSFPADYPANPAYSGMIRPALTSFADEVCATVARLFAYVGVLALFGILGLHAVDRLQDEFASWSVADRSFPAFALSPQDASDKLDKSDTYVILRHPAGGRQDVLRWSGTSEKPAAELEIYRPGGEYPPEATARAELAVRMLPKGAELEAAGVIASKFGSVALLRQAGAAEGFGACLGFFKRIDDPALQISGWSYQGNSLPARRAAIDCMLSRLMLLTAGNEPKLAEYFARAELRRGSCAPAPADWITGAENPRLRGVL